MSENVVEEMGEGEVMVPRVWPVTPSTFVDVLKMRVERLGGRLRSRQVIALAELIAEVLGGEGDAKDD